MFHLQTTVPDWPRAVYYGSNEFSLERILGIELPVEVDRGKRLVQIFLGALLSRHTSNERGYRFS